MHQKKFDPILKSVSSLFRVLSHPDRIRMVGLLQNAEMDVTQLHQVMELSQSVVSQHLKLFRFQGLVEDRKEGTHVYYRLKKPILVNIVLDAIELQSQDFTQSRAEVSLLKEMRILWEKPSQH